MLNIFIQMYLHYRMSGITKNRKRVTAANANKKQKKSKKKVSINAAELEEMVSRQDFFFIKICYNLQISFQNLKLSYFLFLMLLLMLFCLAKDNH